MMADPDTKAFEAVVSIRAQRDDVRERTGWAPSSPRTSRDAATGSDRTGDLRALQARTARAMPHAAVPARGRVSQSRPGEEKS
jgi:hypothetical protein